MLSKKQKDWLNHLSSEKKINILPFDPMATEIFLKIKSKIQDNLGKDTRVEHRGASSLGISGQDEIDVYVPVPPSVFDLYIPKMSKIFGEPRSLCPLERVRFSEEIDGKKIDLFLINDEHDDWINGCKFENYLKSHPKDLEVYRKLKEEMNGFSVKDYYTRKNEFINKILKKANKPTNSN
jgi:GrpB-like predicted nucleotidyltransferase (UPF0157 family)